MKKASPGTNPLPLPAQLRPKNLDEFVGQEHLVGKGKPIRVAIEERHLFSFILWGPPGSGKTTLARIYANALDAKLFELSAVSAGKDDIKKILKEDTNGQPRVLFLDEIHRFNKAQQDFLLPYVESGELTLVGATTENPSFEIISALLSRARVFVLYALSEAAMQMIIRRATPEIADDALLWLTTMANGDARQALSVIGNAKNLYGEVTLDSLKEALQSQHLRYDKKGEEHYDTISAFIKSMRASQPDAALYYLARMIAGGEDPLFIARRMVIFASEDIGLAQPTALVVANAVFRACEMIGYPECAINLAHGVAYLAEAKKDRRAYEALRAAEEDVHAYGNLPIPLKIRNAPTALMKELEYGKGYQKYDADPYLPEKIKKKKYLAKPKDNKKKE
jgi:putative ATPase